MRIVSVANEKGGVGKTTTTMSLAAVAAEANRVLVVDIDPQGSCAWWADRAETVGEPLPFEVVVEQDPRLLSRLREAPFDVVFVDTPGNLSVQNLLTLVVAHSDYVVLPTEAAALAIPPLVKTIDEIIRPSGVPFRVLVNRVDGGRRNRADEVFAQLDRAHIPRFATAIRRYAAHERAPEDGQVVTQFPQTRDTRSAIEDYRRVAVELFSEWSRIGQPPAPGRAADRPTVAG